MAPRGGGGGSGGGGGRAGGFSSSGLGSGSRGGSSSTSSISGGKGGNSGSIPKPNVVTGTKEAHQSQDPKEEAHLFQDPEEEVRLGRAATVSKVPRRPKPRKRPRLQSTMAGARPLVTITTIPITTILTKRLMATQAHTSQQLSLR